VLDVNKLRSLPEGRSTKYHYIRPPQQTYTCLRFLYEHLRAKIKPYRYDVDRIVQKLIDRGFAIRQQNEIHLTVQGYLWMRENYMTDKQLEWYIQGELEKRGIQATPRVFNARCFVGERELKRLNITAVDKLKDTETLIKRARIIGVNLEPVFDDVRCIVTSEKVFLILDKPKTLTELLLSYVIKLSRLGLRPTNESILRLASEAKEFRTRLVRSLMCYCPSCNKILLEDYRYCPYCALNLDKVAQEVNLRELFLELASVV